MPTAAIHSPMAAMAMQQPQQQQHQHHHHHQQQHHHQPQAALQQQRQQQQPLRRAVYVHVSDVVTNAYNIDHAKLEEELSRVKSTSVSGKTDSVPAVGGDRYAAAAAGVPTEFESASYSQKRLQPPRGGFNLCVLVGKVQVVVDKRRVDGSQVRLAEVEVGDETGTVSLRARDDQIDTLGVISERAGAVVLRNCTLELYQGKHVRLAITKWGKLSPYPDQVASTPPPPSKMNLDRNFSLIDLSLVANEMAAATTSSSTTAPASAIMSRPEPYEDAGGGGSPSVPPQQSGGGGGMMMMMDRSQGGGRVEMMGFGQHQQQQHPHHNPHHHHHHRGGGMMKAYAPDPSVGRVVGQAGGGTAPSPANRGGGRRQSRGGGGVARGSNVGGGSTGLAMYGAEGGMPGPTNMGFGSSGGGGGGVVLHGRYGAGMDMHQYSYPSHRDGQPTTTHHHQQMMYQRQFELQQRQMHHVYHNAATPVPATATHQEAGGQRPQPMMVTGISNAPTFDGSFNSGNQEQLLRGAQFLMPAQAMVPSRMAQHRTQQQQQHHHAIRSTPPSAKRSESPSQSRMMNPQAATFDPHGSGHAGS